MWRWKIGWYVKGWKIEWYVKGWKIGWCMRIMRIMPISALVQVDKIWVDVLPTLCAVVMIFFTFFQWPVTDYDFW